ncbi:MAG: nuclear transport factor 2 family protein [Burkholderiaceae bacterium]
MPSRATVERFIAMVQANQHVEAIEAFYAEDATMQENHETPRFGLANLVEHERQMLSSVKSVYTHPVDSFFVEDDRSVIHWVFDFTLPDARVFRIDELAHQNWYGDKIVRERFFYDPARRWL